MILNTSIIEDIKQKTNLSFDKAKDIEQLANSIFKSTGRTIGVTTLKRLLGLVNDDRKSNEYTLNTIAIFLGHASWKEYSSIKNLDSIWQFNEEAVVISQLTIGQTVTVHYLNRIITFEVIEYENKNCLKVISTKNSSLKVNDILEVLKICKGQPLIAEKVIRANVLGKYKTNGEVKFLHVH